VLDSEHALRNDEYHSRGETPRGVARDARDPQHVFTSLPMWIVTGGGGVVKSGARTGGHDPAAGAGQRSSARALRVAAAMPAASSPSSARMRPASPCGR
jgi:hypothetical protein